jgi:hypothetical protein
MTRYQSTCCRIDALTFVETLPHRVIGLTRLVKLTIRRDFRLGQTWSLRGIQATA